MPLVPCPTCRVTLRVSNALSKERLTVQSADFTGLFQNEI